MKAQRFGLLAATFVAAAGCGTSAYVHPTLPGAPPGSPLGKSYTLIPVPHDDQTLLGRMLEEIPDDGRSLDAASQPNDCESRLAPMVTGTMSDQFEDSIELAQGAHADVTLSVFELGVKSDSATHIYYKLDVTQRIARRDTREYLDCCRDHAGACGYGYVSELLFGRGEYFAVKESNDIDASVTLPIASAGGFIRAKILKRRTVEGFVAALVKSQSTQKALGPLGDPEALGYRARQATLTGQVKDRYMRARVDVVAMDVPRTDRSGADYAYVFRDGLGNITENDFIDRYSSVLHNGELDSARSTRRATHLLIGSSALVAGAAATALGVHWMNHGGVDANNTCDAKTCLALYGGILTALLGVGDIVLALAWFDSDPLQHTIDRADAELYVDNYNQALYTRTINDTRTRMRHIQEEEQSKVGRVQPIVGPGYIGIRGEM